MPRPREFDPVDALDKAMRLFWERGYAETSMRDLVAHTGVAPAGLYAAFGGKREIFRAALKHYHNTYGDMLFGPLEREDAARAAVEHVFRTLVNALVGTEFSNGCFMCNTAVEFGDEPGEMMARVFGNLERMIHGFERALRQARKRGEVRANLDPRRTAHLLAALFHGIAVLSRAKADRTIVRDAVASALRCLD